MGNGDGGCERNPEGRWGAKRKFREEEEEEMEQVEEEEEELGKDEEGGERRWRKTGKDVRFGKEVGEGSKDDYEKKNDGIV